MNGALSLHGYVGRVGCSVRCSVDEEVQRVVMLETGESGRHTKWDHFHSRLSGWPLKFPFIVV